MKALLVIAYKDYQDKEFSDTYNALKESGIDVKIASSSHGSALGKYGGKVEIDFKIDEVDPNMFDAVVFIGGGGAQEYFESKAAHKLIKMSAELNKLIAAICCAPMILLKAGILNNKNATVWPDNKWIEDISKAGNYIEKDVVQDGNIITASGPEAAKKFGETIVKSMK